MHSMSDANITNLNHQSFSANSAWGGIFSFRKYRFQFWNQNIVFKCFHVKHSKLLCARAHLDIQIVFLKQNQDTEDRDVCEIELSLPLILLVEEHKKHFQQNVWWKMSYSV